MTPKSFAVFAAALILAVAVGPVAATDVDLSVAADQPSAGSDATVDVTDNGTAVENASVTVVAVNGTYDAAFDNVTDANGTVTLPAPDENVTVDITAEYENETATTTLELLTAPEADEEEEADNFGAMVSKFVHSLLNGDEEQQRIGRLIANWVVENNPGNAPDHAGPPGDRGPSSSASFDAGGNETAGNVTSSSGPGYGNGNGNGNGNGPPENPGNGNGKAEGNGK